MAYNKTRLCKFMNNCKFGNQCTFAHSENELYKSPCWFYNNGGCKNEKCSFSHIIVNNLRKPIQIQKPCKYQNECINQNCQFDHFELTENEWKYHFIGIRYPGVGYYKSEKNQKQKPEIKISFEIKGDVNFEFGSKLEQSSFPILGKRIVSNNIVNSVWQKNTISNPEKQKIEELIKKETKNIPPPILQVILQSNEYTYDIKKGRTWADEIEM